MKLHANARTCPNSRKLLVTRIEEESWSLMPAAEAAGISERSARKWLARWRAEGEAGLTDRSSAPRRVPSRLPADRLEAIEALRRLRMTAAEIAEVLGMALSTVSRWLARIGLGKRSHLEPPEPSNRYERKRPGELIHVDVKKLGRILAAGHRVTGQRKSQVSTRKERKRHGKAGWEFVHVCVDDATRLAYVEVLADEKGATAAGFLRRAVRWFKGMGITVERVLSDNGACYRSTLHAEACAELGMRHLFTRPYRPAPTARPSDLSRRCRTAGPTEPSMAPRQSGTAALHGWLDHYNFRRRHGSLGHRPPAVRLAELEQRGG
jgi:transposase InsO family protein